MTSHIRGKKLLVQGAGRGNLGIVKSARAHGVYTIATGLGGNYPCSKLVDKECFADITDCDAVLTVARENKIDGAIICCSDTGLHAVGRCNDVLRLSGITERSSIVSSNKNLMKEALINNNVRTARYYKISNLTELNQAVEQIGYPIIIKATDLQGSRGINIVKQSLELEDAFNNVMSQTKVGYCIVEQFLIGREYGAQAFVYNDEVLFVLPHGDETILCKTAVPVGHYMPYELSDSLKRDTELQVKNAIKALRLNNCAINVDLIEVDGKAYIIELTGRVGANCLPELVSNYFGINYYDMILYTALGEDPRPIFEARKHESATLARMIQSDKSGILKSISEINIPDIDLLMFVKVGDEVRQFTNCNDAIGQIVVQGATLSECETKITEALSRLNLIIE